MRRNQRGRPWNRETKASLDRAWQRKWAYPTLIAQHRQALAAHPDELAARYVLANCLYADGQIEAAEVEWEIVAQSGSLSWAEIVQEARQALADDRKAGE